jgi:hypothetical protein
LEVLSRTHAVVRQRKDDLLCVFDYTFAGEDLTISARIENQHQDAPLEVTGFSGLTFAFDRPPTGLFQAMHPTYSQAHGIEVCHPSFQTPIGGSWAADDKVGVGFSPWKTGLERTLILLDYGSWEPDKRDHDPVRKLLYFCPAPIPPRGARTFDLRIRVSPNRAWQHLLEPYREHFQNTFGPVRYQADPRWIATDYLNASQQAISPSNPYGSKGRIGALTPRKARGPSATSSSPRSGPTMARASSCGARGATTRAAACIGPTSTCSRRKSRRSGPTSSPLASKRRACGLAWPHARATWP